MDLVQEQIDAFNARDLERFLACYDESFVCEDNKGNILSKGREAQTTGMSTMFEQSPELHCEVLSEIRMGPYVVCLEKTTGMHMGDFPTDLESISIYRVNGGKITHQLILF